ncbi:MAG: NTP transferase domain-containing protein [Bdellovibrionales bacterium]|nr:NTP transferase domain-containing protein [Bdellovibrionales bacterium]
MQIDHCLILAAGFGTRMGQIGQKLPKVLWPVFEKSLLELQVGYARSLGATKIYINLHYMGEEIEQYCKGKSIFEDVTFLWEKPEILDIGGAVHNLAARPDVNYRGKLLVLNADQFFYLKKEEMEKFLNPFAKSPGVLFSYMVNSSSGYNALEMNDKREVKSIINNKDLAPETKVETYTGISYIDLAQLTPIKGASSFFDSVCPFKEKSIPAILLKDVDYWDFGTLKRYWETSFRILETYSSNSNHPFLRFLVNEKAMKTWKIDLLKFSYNAKVPRVINLGNDVFVQDSGPAIFLNQVSAKKVSANVICWNELTEEIK